MVNVLLPWFLALLCFVILVAGVRDKVVIYYDKTDFWLSFLPWAILLIGTGFLVHLQGDGEVDFNNLSTQQSSAWTFTLVIALLSSLEAARRSIKYNRNLPLGILLAPFKVLFSLFAIIGLVGQISRMTDSKSSMSTRLGAAVMFFILNALREELINGKDVYKDKGWVMEDKETKPVFKI